MWPFKKKIIKCVQQQLPDEIDKSQQVRAREWWEVYRREYLCADYHSKTKIPEEILKSFGEG